MSEQEPPTWSSLFGAAPGIDLLGNSEAHVIEVIEQLVAPGWRPNEGYQYDNPTEAYAAGRNWMIDRIREALRGEDVSMHYPTTDKPQE